MRKKTAGAADGKNRRNTYTKNIPKVLVNNAAFFRSGGRSAVGLGFPDNFPVNQVGGGGTGVFKYFPVEFGAHVHLSSHLFKSLGRKAIMSFSGNARPRRKIR